MAANPFLEVSKLGQSIWYDNIERRLLEDGTIKTMIEKGEIRGITSNPSIFCKAITTGKAYEPAIRAFLNAHPHSEVKELYESLVIADIRKAADLLRPVYNKTRGEDGYVSIEVSPKLAYQTKTTVEEARRLFATIDRPNIMIKVPATPEGIPAFRELLTEGINVNVTLIFSHQDYRDVAEAYIAALEARLKSKKPLETVASVASFFVSRLDSKMDKALPAGSRLRGRVAVAYSKITYEDFQKVLASTRFKELQSKGARIQRLLWGSTGTKNPEYNDLLYVDTLIGPHTVNTVPPDALNAFRDHGTPNVTVTTNLDEAKRILEETAAAGIDLAKITRELKQEGVVAFEKAFDDLIKALAAKKEGATCDECC